MSLININNANTVSRSISGIKNVTFNYLGFKPTGIQPIDRLTGVFISDIVVANSGFVKWLDVDWGGNPNDYDIAFFVRSSSSDISNVKWSGPFYNKTFDISDQKGKNLQFMIVMTTDTSSIPKVEDVTIKYVTSTSSSKFYSKSFNLGFKPRNILLTYNADLGTDTIVKFSVSGKDSIDPLDYQVITPNEIETLNNIPNSSDQIKVLMELSGEFTTSVSIHEYSFLVGGDDATRINKEEDESSSQYMSSDSSSSSSSSIDSSSSQSSSSSSSSEDYSSSSSSS